MKKRKIVLVDDDTNILDSLERVLMCDEYEILKCDDPVKAGDLIDSRSGNVDVMISDNKMPGIKGTDVLISLRNKYPNVIRIMLTGQSDLADAQSAINEGEVYRFLIKPVNPYEMELVVKRALAHRDLWLDNKRLLEKVKEQDVAIKSLETEYPGITKVTRDEDGNILINETYCGESFDDYIKQCFK